MHQSTWTDDNNQRRHLNIHLCHKHTGDSRFLCNASRFIENWNIAKLKTTISQNIVHQKLSVNPWWGLRLAHTGFYTINNRNWYKLVGWGEGGVHFKQPGKKRAQLWKMMPRVQSNFNQDTFLGLMNNWESARTALSCNTFCVTVCTWIKHSLSCRVVCVAAIRHHVVTQHHSGIQLPRPSPPRPLPSASSPHVCLFDY